jgi:hypothetical protein
MMTLEEIIHKKLADLDHQMEEYDRWWSQELKIVIAKCVALEVFLIILIWSLLCYV